MIALLGPLLVFGVTGLLMGAMWRQMRRVNAHTAATRRAADIAAPAPAEAALEEFDAEHGVFVGRKDETNSELIRQGARSRQSGWYLEP